MLYLKICYIGSSAKRVKIHSEFIIPETSFIISEISFAIPEILLVISKIHYSRVCYIDGLLYNKLLCVIPDVLWPGIFVCYI